MSHTGDRLLDGLKRRGIVPTSQALLQNSDILAMADDVVEGTITPLIIGLREDYFTVFDYTVTVPNQVEYAIPYRSIGRTLREVKLCGTGVLADAPTKNKRRLTHIALVDCHMFQASSTPMGFYPRGDKIALVPPCNSDQYTLELSYPLKPSRIVTTSQAAQVQSVTTGQVVVTAVPAEITTSCCIDFIQGKQGNAILAMDKIVTGIAGTTLSFAAADIPSTLQAGDWISVSETSPVIQLPDVCYSLLESYLAQRILQAIGDFEAAAAFEGKIAEEKNNVRLAMAQRIEGEPKKVINRGGLIRGARSRYRYGYAWR